MPNDKRRYNTIPHLSIPFPNFLWITLFCFPLCYLTSQLQQYNHLIRTNVILNILDGKICRWNKKVKAIFSVDKDRNTETVPLKVLLRDLLTTQVDHRDSISTETQNIHTDQRQTDMHR